MAYNKRLDARVDDNQSAIVKSLNRVPGVSVEADHHDLIVGYRRRSWWIEIKTEDARSKKTGKVKPSELTPSEKRRLADPNFQYDVCFSAEEILKVIGVIT